MRGILTNFQKEFDDEVRELLEWSDNLDFDKYFGEWQKMSTSDKSENYSNSLKVLSLL